MKWIFLKKSNFKILHSAIGIVINVVMVQGHEYDVDNDAEGDGQLREGVKDQEGQYLRGLEPDIAAIPDAKDVNWFFEVLAKDLFVLRTFVIVIIYETTHTSWFTEKKQKYIFLICIASPHPTTHLVHPTTSNHHQWTNSPTPASYN